MLETQARNACASDAVYGQKVLRLQWIASVWQENESTVRRHCQPDPKSPWYTLAMYQRRRLAPLATNELEHPHPVNIGDGDGTGVQHNKIGALLQQQSSPSSTVCEAVCRSDETGVILIPAAAWSSPTSTGNKVQFMASFLGGQQLFVKEDCVLEYILPKHFLPTGSARYLFTCRIATAHRSEKPISLTIGGDCGVSYEVALPYTMGMWGETEPVVVELDGSKQNSVVPLRLARSHQPFGFALKDLRLVPVLK